MTIKEAIETLEANYPDACYEQLREAVDLAIYALKQPEIIHCRDCKHWLSEEYIGNNNVHTLNIASLPCKNWLTGGDWFCGSAERREEEGGQNGND